MYPGGRQDTGVLQGHSPDVPWWTPGHWGTPGALPRCTLVDARTLGYSRGTPPMYPGGRQDTGVLQGHSPDVPWWTPGHWGTPGALPRCTLVDARTLGYSRGTPPMYPGGRQDTGVLQGHSPDVPWWTPGHWGTPGALPRCTLVDARTLGYSRGTPPMYPGGRQDTGVLQGHSPDVPWWTPGHWGTPGALPEYPGGCFFPTFYQIIVPKVVSKNTKAVTIDKVAALQQLGLEMREVSSAVLPQWSPGGWGTAGVLPPVVPSGHQEAEEQQGYSPVVASGHQEAGEQQGYSPSGCQWIPLGGWGTATSTQVVTSGQQLRGTPPNGPQWAPGGWGTAGVLPQVVHQEAGEQQGYSSSGCQWIPLGGWGTAGQLRGTPPSGPQWTAAEGYSPSGHQEAGEQHGYSPQWSPVDTRRLRNRRGTPPSGHQWIPGGCVEQQGYSPGGHQWTPGGWGTAGVLPQWSPVDTGRKLGNSWGTPQWYSGYQWEAGEQQKVPKWSPVDSS
ncbi:hypothetical protein F5887DRAFT_1088096 [Amanita rubescens]|nr:hypothetical protein F5887DRAFT_1088096 [Amanita rubescens]